jgi:hypothetical protein
MRSIVEIVAAIKSLIPLVFAILLLGSANAQPIIGIGDFKIGMSITDFLNAPEIRSKIVRESSAGDILSQMNDGGTVWKTDNKSRVEDYRKIFSAGISKYEFKMSLSESEINEQGLSAEFYEGLLIKLTVNRGFSLKFLDILKNKYGEPKVTNKMKSVVCQNGYGAKFERNDGSLHYEWGSENPINAEIVVLSLSCGKFFSILYTVKDVVKANLVFQAEQKLKKAYEEEIKKQNSASSKL